ncbi:MAG: TIGR03960 family B12-binding radical SAM protein [Clostridiales bacterium]|nr:TIGR03960 family B12-binding radical SAM protein [Clostridiales bacterium]
MSLEKDLERILPKVEKPARYIGGEVNSINKNTDEIKSRFVFAFPDIYEIGMSHLGLQILYFVLNLQKDIFCERVFAPAHDMENIMREKKIPLFSLESKTPLKEADVIGFTLQYELSYSNILNMLDLSDIPLLSKDRDNTHPFICAGGPCAYNPEPLADIIDFFILGEGETINAEIMKKHILWKESGKDKFEFLKEIAQMQGVYVPSLYDASYSDDHTIQTLDKLYEWAPDEIMKNIEPDLDEAYYPEKFIVPYIDVVHNRAVVEIFRGCTRGCRFCQAGIIYLPVRERSMEKIQEIADNLIKNTGHEEMSLISLSSSDYSNIEPLVTSLMSKCGDENISLSLPSLRLDSFSFKVLEEIQRVKKSGLTFAPEAGTQRLRNVINKNITDDDIYNAVENAFKLGWGNIKFYFMIGLPTETYEDLDGIVDIAKIIVDIFYRVRDRKSKKMNITISTSNFVPKPHTPFQWVPMDDIEALNAKQKYLSEKLKKMKHVTYNYHDTETSFLEAVLARGDRRIGRVLVEAFKQGCKFDGWREFFDFGKWMLAFQAAQIDPYLFSHRDRRYEDVLPWDYINTGVSKEFLISENEKAIREDLTLDCRNGCTNCGINKVSDCKVW